MQLKILAIWLILMAQVARSMHSGESSESRSKKKPLPQWKAKAPQKGPMLPSISDAFPGHSSPSRASPSHFSPLSSATPSPSMSPIRTQPPSPKSGGPVSPVLLVPPPKGQKMGWFKKEINKPQHIWDPLVHTAWARVREKVLSRGGTGVFWKKPE